MSACGQRYNSEHLLYADFKYFQRNLTRMNKFALVLVALSMLPQSTALKCYVGILSYTKKMDCNSNAKYCLKTVNGGLSTYFCADAPTSNLACDVFGAGKCFGNYSATGSIDCCCNSDYCNASPIPQKSITLIIATMIASIIAVLICH